LICGTTGVAVVQCPGGITFYSLFRLEIDEQLTRSLRFNLGRHTAQAQHILAAGLVMFEEVSVLTRWLTNRVEWRKMLGT
jgi:hypothetical protein